MVEETLYPFDDGIDDGIESENVLIDLQDNHQEQARQLAQAMDNSSRQWSVFQQALALSGFQAWISERQPELTIDTSKASVRQPAYANVIDAVCHCKVGEFVICLLPIWGLEETDEVLVPRAVIDLPEYAAHFYVLVAIDESQELAEIQSFLHYGQMKQICSEIGPDMDWHYPLSAEAFNGEVSELLLDLTCLAPEGITLPAVPPDRKVVLRQLRPVLEPILPQLHSQPLWKVLSWEQAATVLTSPDLLMWLQHRPNIAEGIVQTTLTDLWQLISQSAVNVYRWTQEQIDISTTSGWNLALESAARSRTSEGRSRYQPNQKLAALLRDLPVELPPETVATGHVYQDVPFIHKPVRVYAVVWPQPHLVDTWDLLVIAGALPGDDPPDGLQLRISDVTGTLVEETLIAETNQAYIYGQVEGTFDERFLVTLTDTNGEVISLTPFEYQPEVVS